MLEPFIGTIALFGFNFAPNGWAHCHGQLISIQQNSALFALLGTLYGGDGVTTFALPDLRGRAPIGFGQGPAQPNYLMGQTGGTPAVTLTSPQMPHHSHGVSTADAATSKMPTGNLPAISTGGASYGPTAAGSMAPAMVQPAGGNQPHENMSPYLAGNWCIALVGVFPARS